ncbi:MAG: thioredoxin domain-containing protein [Anaerolineales bacterium]|nr:thioredoxin domain-containing protein [Anaerolineales bacterium]
MTNKLINETSPYLLQHAENPVEWHPWGEEALTRAQTENKPIFLSIGYSACHWCHVMAHESFEDPATAAIMNRHYINVKVDREERPDLDSIYMSAVQALTGRGGWPMSIFLTPDGFPLYGGTYFPPQPRYGMPSFSQVLLAVADAWQNKRDQLLQDSKRLVQTITQQERLAGSGSSEPLRRQTLHSSFEEIKNNFDRNFGGWGAAPKFPQPMILEFLLSYHYATGNVTALDMVNQTLEAMARGGMYDQLGGGFHRYSVDERWLVPHFEKMLYDNAQLARVYLHAWQVTGNPFFRRITEETLDYVLREMTGPEGGFYATQDADSEGEEGKFFVWTVAEIRQVLAQDAGAFIRAYAVTESGNFEGKNILEYVGDLQERASLYESRQKLFSVREARIHPGRDEKIVTAWNGLMLAAMTGAARAFDRADYRLAADKNARFILNHLLHNGQLKRTWKDGQVKINAFLEDHAAVIYGLLAHYQTTFDARWYSAAHDLAGAMIAHYSAPDGGFFETSDDHEKLITRPRDLQDNATPSGNAMAVTTLLKLAGLTNNLRYVEIAHRSLAQIQPMMAHYPLGFGQWLQALIYALSTPREIAIVGDPGSPETMALLNVVRDGYRPFQVVALGPYDIDAPVPLLQDRGLIDSQATAYVCREFTCMAPVTEPEALHAQLGQQPS